MKDNSNDDPKHIWASKYSLSASRRVFVHFTCAFYSPISRYNDGVWYNLSKEVNRGRNNACKICKSNGATLGCENSRCTFNVHVTCAMKSLVTFFYY